MLFVQVVGSYFIKKSNKVNAKHDLGVLISVSQTFVVRHIYIMFIYEWNIK